MTLISLSHKRQLDPILIKVLSCVDAVARSQGARYLLTGAMARELLLVHVHGLPPGRATRDVDFGVLLENWDSFAAFRRSLVETGDFLTDKAIHTRHAS